MTDPIPTGIVTTIEDDATAVIKAADTIAPAIVTKTAAWYSRYAKGIVAFLGVSATAALLEFPPDGPIYKYAGYVLGAVTIIGVIAKANGKTTTTIIPGSAS